MPADVGAKSAPRSGERPERGALLDDIGRALIKALQHDGRRSYSALAADVGLSEASVRARVQRLVDTGVIQIVAVTDPTEMGYARQAMIGVKVQGSPKPVADALAAMEQVEYIVFTAGSFDLLVEVVAGSDLELLNLVTEDIRSLPGVVTTETFVYLKLHKQTYSWFPPQ